MKSVVDLLNIPSPTGFEDKIFAHIKAKLSESDIQFKFLQHNHSLIATPQIQSEKPHVIFVGHTDVVPEFFAPHVKDGKLYGAGASDMKGSLGVYLQLIADCGKSLLKNFNVSFVFYEKEEQTPMNENGLFALLQTYPDFFKSVDLAIVGEPTDLDVHLGCLGSLHARFEVLGRACHSARPWNGQNAITKALPVLEALSHLPSVPHTIFGVTFHDVIQVTELAAEPGRTSLPGWVRGNVNFRFAPLYSCEEAKVILANHLQAAGLKASDYTFIDVAPAAKIIETELFKSVIQSLARPVQAKQAWTDVAQLSEFGIACFNFGVGHTEQAHQKNEFVLLSHLQTYYDLLKSFLV